MVEWRCGLIASISSFVSAAYVFNVAYNVGKAVVNRMEKDMAEELCEFIVEVFSLWPGSCAPSTCSRHARWVRCWFTSSIDPLWIRFVPNSWPTISYVYTCVIGYFAAKDGSKLNANAGSEFSANQQPVDTFTPALSSDSNIHQFEFLGVLVLREVFSWRV